MACQDQPAQILLLPEGPGENALPEAGPALAGQPAPGWSCVGVRSTLEKWLVRVYMYLSTDS